MNRRTAWIFLITITAIMAVGFIFPAVSVLKEAFINPHDGTFSLGYFSMVLTDPVYQEGIINALNLGLVSTLMAASDCGAFGGD
jgi:ABC-type uncharacterized transport system permease subunit